MRAATSILVATCLALCPLAAHAVVMFDTSAGTGAPPGLLGGFTMAGFPADPTPEGTMISQLAPPPAAPVTGNLSFLRPSEHMTVGSIWDTWSHGYGGDVYHVTQSDQTLTLPTGTLAFYMYLQPNLKSLFEFRVDSGTTSTTLLIQGDGGARYVGIYTDDLLSPLSSVSILQTTQDSEGFAMGEFGINLSSQTGPPIPEPASAALLLGGLAAGLLLRGRRRNG